MGIAPSAAVHVGDSVPADVVGARAVGIRPVLIERLARDHPVAAAEPTTPVVHPDAADVLRISDLWGLVELLGIPRPVAVTSGS